MTILMCNAAWMKYYEGITDSDYPINGGSFPAANGYGHEVINFQRNGQFVYGYVQARNSTINIDRIGGNGRSYVDNVLVVWRARSSYGSVVVGWYRNAIVYRTEQTGNSNRYFNYKDETYYPGYSIRARANDAFLIPVQHRVFQVPVNHKGFGSQTFVSFLDKDLDEVNQFKVSLMDYISRVENGDFSSPIKGRRGLIDTETKEKIETNAIEAAIEFYIQRGYDVQTRESENVGYDLLASKERETLHIEVKGSSIELPANVNVMLTPNEYAVSKKSKTKYRICIVINALENPEIFEFIWDKQRQSWFCEQSLSCLKIKESIAANLFIINCQ